MLAIELFKERYKSSNSVHRGNQVDPSGVLARCLVYYANALFPQHANRTKAASFTPPS